MTNEHFAAAIVADRHRTLLAEAATHRLATQARGRMRTRRTRRTPR